MKARAALFVVLSYALMLAMGVLGGPVVLWREDWTRAWMKLYIRLSFPLARMLVGLRVEVRGPVPQGDVLIAAKHQSMLEILALFEVLPRARFVMKRELLWTPVFGLFARRAGAVPIDRSRGRGMVRRMVDAFHGMDGQVVIFPEGTRVPPGTKGPYRGGVRALYRALGRPLVLVGTNAGHFWPKSGLGYRPGTAVIEILEEVIPPGHDAEEVGALIEQRIEALSRRLADEARLEGR